MMPLNQGGANPRLNHDHPVNRASAIGGLRRTPPAVAVRIQSKYVIVRRSTADNENSSSLQGRPSIVLDTQFPWES